MSARLLLSCGEASGDLYAGALTRELRALDPTIAVAGLGGPQFAAAGGRLVDDYRDLAVTGLTEAIAKLPRSFAARRRLVADARAAAPDALVADRLSRFQLPPGAARQAARRAGRLLHQPADLGVAAGRIETIARSPIACW